MLYFRSCNDKPGIIVVSPSFHLQHWLLIRSLHCCYQQTHPQILQCRSQSHWSPLQSCYHCDHHLGTRGRGERGRGQSKTCILHLHVARNIYSYNYELLVTTPYPDVFGGKAATGWSVVGANSLLCCCLKEVGYILLSLCRQEKEEKGGRDIMKRHYNIFSRVSAV